MAATSEIDFAGAEHAIERAANGLGRLGRDLKAVSRIAQDLAREIEAEQDLNGRLKAKITAMTAEALNEGARAARAEEQSQQNDALTASLVANCRAMQNLISNVLSSARSLSMLRVDD